MSSTAAIFLQFEMTVAFNFKVNIFLFYCIIIITFTTHKVKRGGKHRSVMQL